jgi:choline dehydrogenase-like flavoprotein
MCKSTTHISDFDRTDIHHSDGQENGTTVPGLAVPGKYLRTDTSVPQAGLDNRTSPLYTGVVVGGGTVVNGMFFARGSAGDYDAWENLGNPGWGWEGLLPYFKKVRLLP